MIAMEDDNIKHIDIRRAATVILGMGVVVLSACLLMAAVTFVTGI